MSIFFRGTGRRPVKDSLIGCVTGRRPVPRERVALVALTLFVGIGVGGCAREKLPIYELTDAQTTLRQLAERSPTSRVRTISAEGQVELRRADGQSVRVDAALAAEPPEHVRLRAWKFGHAALDLTLTPDGLWLAQSRRAQQDSPTTVPAGLNAGQFRRMWKLIDGGLFRDPASVAETSGRALIVRRQAPEGVTIICHADRATLTPRRYEILDESGRVRFTLRLDRYATFPDDIVWPRRIVADSEHGRIAVDLRTVEFNQELPPGAFVPPRRAQMMR